MNGQQVIVCRMADDNDDELLQGGSSSTLLCIGMPSATYWRTLPAPPGDIDRRPDQPAKGSQKLF